MESEGYPIAAKNAWSVIRPLVLDRALADYVKHCGVKGKVLVAASLIFRLALVVCSCVTTYLACATLGFWLLIAIPAGLAAHYLPLMIVRIVNKRRVQVIKEIPSLLSLLKVFAATTVATKGALSRVGHEISDSCPILGAEIDALNRDSIKASAGVLGEDLHKLAERLESHELRLLAEAVTIGESKGIDLGFVIDQQSSAIQSYWRNKREAQFASVPVKAAIVALLFAAPLVFAIFVGPVFFTCYYTLGPIMGTR